MDLPLLHYFKEPAVSSIFLQRLLQRLSSISDALESIEKVETELRFNIQCSKELSENDNQILKWVLSETFERSKFSSKSFLESKKKDFEMSQPQLHATIFEVGPRLSFTTAWSTNAVTIFNVCGIDSIKRIEKSTRYLVVSKLKLERQDIDALLDEIHDKMTECEYTSPLLSFKIQHKEQPTINVPLLERGREALEEINKELGLAFDEQDIDLYLNMFKEMKRNPTSVELFDMAQSNSEHSRHWFFRGRIVIDGKEMPDSLMSIVKQTLGKDTNSVLAFCDNASAIKGREVELLLPKETFKSSSLELKKALYHITFTAETHNFPTGVAPFPGAETGTGGRIRDVHAIGKGGLVLAGTAAYCVGNLNIPNYHLPWENSSFKYPNNIAKPLKIIIEASNGASDYGNKFGEPVIQGFCRSFGMHVNKEERREWIKPIMFTGGIGQVDALHLEKGKPEKEMAVIKIGGPAYRIGMGGGAASSIAIHGQNVASLDFNAVQRGDAEMEQKLNRVIRACVEMGEDNPIVSIHDQGAGGSGNVLKEIVDPEGAKINIRKMVVGDETLSVLELWGAEYQENDAVLIRPKHLELFDQICKRERLPYAVVGIVTGDGKIVVYDEKDNSTPVNLDLEKVLGKMPPKTFHSQKLNKNLKPLVLPENITIKESLERVLRLVSVGSKLFLTNKVDRSVTGLIAQQQCVGPLQLPLSNVAVIAQSHLTTSGAALSIGEQPIKGLINSSAMARMSIGEMLTNIVWAKLSDLQDIKCSGNWMWAAKLPGEGSEMYEAAVAMRDLMKELNIGIDGGKDSLSMAAKLNHETIKAPGMLTISGYATCPDITKVITPDIKYPGASNIYFIDLGEKKDRMGGSSLAHVFNQIGDQSPDVVSVDNLRNSFNAVQLLIERGMISCGHDRSDGGLIVSLLEMAFAGNCGVAIKVKKERISSTSTSTSTSSSSSIINFFFNEELGLLFEVPKNKEQQVQEFLHQSKIEYEVIASTTQEKKITIEVQSEDSNTLIMQEEMVHLRDIWNETSHQLELLQANPKCVHEETSFLKNRKGISYNIPFHPENTASSLLNRISDLKPKVAVIREEGTNGDREMLTSLYMAGFEAWDVSMSDLTQNKIQLDLFKGVVLPGGFSFGDVTGSSKGWAAAIRFAREGQVWNQFQSFYERKDTWSLGVCNGCQLMALLGWVPMQGLSDDTQPRFLHNESGRFESRFSLVKILESPAVLLKGMENSVIGVWVAHGEGRAYFPSKDILDKVLNDKLAPIRYVDDDHLITEQYPFNPNGSPLGIASLCSPDGRHLAIMPHPERSVLKWQWPYHTSVSSSHVTSPWMKLFQNAREFSESQ